MDRLETILQWWIPLVLSLSVHEWAHAYAAFRLGDDTARYLGRLTLNPIAHIDWLGTVLLPLVGVPFGWAKPVPINISRLRGSPRMGIVWTSVAGPLSNACLVVICLAGYALCSKWGTSGSSLQALFRIGAILNTLLALFNLLPIPPLDGSRVVDGLLPDRFRPYWDAFEPVAPIALVAVIALPFLFGTSVVATPIEWVERTLAGIDAFLAVHR